MDLTEPIGKFAYINECIKNNKVAEYRIIDNPIYSDFDITIEENINIFPIEYKEVNDVKIFKDNDKNNDGVINEEEFKNVITSLG